MLPFPIIFDREQLPLFLIQFLTAPTGFFYTSQVALMSLLTAPAALFYTAPVALITLLTASASLCVHLPHLGLADLQLSSSSVFFFTAERLDVLSKCCDTFKMYIMVLQ